MSEVPIKHFWATPTVTLDMSPLQNRIIELQEALTLATARAEAAEARRRDIDDEELTAIEARVTAISTAFSLDVEEALWESAQDVPALIAEVRSLRAERDALRKDAERLDAARKIATEYSALDKGSLTVVRFMTPTWLAFLRVMGTSVGEAK